MNDQLTTLEKNYVEHWSRRRWQIVCSSIVAGSIFWSGVIALTAMRDLYAEGELNISSTIFLLFLGLLGGVFFGFMSWLLGEMRFRRLSKRHARCGT